ncbi:MAG: polymorphic toxin-type HINT domain-containing protein [Pseudomonadota bacterium]
MTSNLRCDFEKDYCVMRRIVKRLQSKWLISLGLLAVFVFGGVSVAGYTGAFSSASPPRVVDMYDRAFDVYRPSEKDWIKVRARSLRPLDILVQGGQVYHIKHDQGTGANGIATVPLGPGTKAALARHISSHVPKDLNFPGRKSEIVYAKWQGDGPWTFQHLGLMKNKQKFVYEGREFVTRVSANGKQAVKPTGNVLSAVTGVWSEHHEKQLHLTLHFPQTGETSKIITTHEHPFYVPSTKTWVDAADLKVGTDLQTCDGTPAHVKKWQEVFEPFTAYNLSVEHTPNYYVRDPENPNSEAVLVHNACRFAKLKDHFARHGPELGVRNAKDYLAQASKHIKSGTRFAFRHDGTQKVAHITRLDVNKFMFTSSTGSGGRIFTHMAVKEQYLNRIGITLPRGF